MTLTNYTGSERELVKDMIHLTGISYTGHLSRDSTYLICKRCVCVCVCVTYIMHDLYTVQLVRSMTRPLSGE